MFLHKWAILMIDPCRKRIIKVDVGVHTVDARSPAPIESCVKPNNQMARLSPCHLLHRWISSITGFGFWIPNDKSAVNLSFTALPWHHFFGSQKSKHDTLSPKTTPPTTHKPWWSTLPRKEKKATLAKPNWRTHSVVPNDSTCYNYCNFYGHIILYNNLHTLKLWRIDTQI